MRKIKYTFILLIFLLASLNANSKYNYDAVSVGIQGLAKNTLQSATFHKDNILYGLDFCHLGIEATSSRTTNGELQYNDNGSLSVNLFMPRWGYRKLFKDKGRIQSYNQIEGYIMIPLLSSSGDFLMDNDQEDILKDALTLFGLKLAHSIEYSFTDQLGLTADVGLNWIFWDMETNDTDNYGSFVSQTRDELNLNLAVTYTKLSLCFKL